VRKKNNWGQPLSPKIFNGWSSSGAIACCGHLISNQNVFIYTTHIKKAIARLYFFILRNEITEKQQQVRNFAEVRNFAWHQVHFQKNAESSRSRLRLRYHLCNAIWISISDPVEFFQNPVRSGTGPEFQNPVGMRSGKRIVFNAGGRHGAEMSELQNFSVRIQSWSAKIQFDSVLFE